jgi:hypothetical protein
MKPPIFNNHGDEDSPAPSKPMQWFLLIFVIATTLASLGGFINSVLN